MMRETIAQLEKKGMLPEVRRLVREWQHCGSIYDLGGGGNPKHIVAMGDQIKSYGIDLYSASMVFDRTDKELRAAMEDFDQRMNAARTANQQLKDHTIGA